MSVKPCIALVILLSVANCASQSHGQEPARPAVIGPDAVWKKALPQSVSEKMLLCVRDDPQFDCIATVMRQAGASRQAIAMMRLLKGEGWMFSFTEMGRVDLAEAVYPFRANTNEGVLLVNGSPQVVDVDGALDWNRVESDIRKDPSYPFLSSKFPQLMLSSPGSFEFMHLLAGGQRFIFRFPLVKGCRACVLVGYAHFGYDFDGGGRFLGARLLHLSRDESTERRPSKSKKARTKG